MRNFPRSLMHLNTDTQLVMLFGRVSGLRPGWRYYVTVGGLWELIVLLHSQFSLCSSCLQFKMWTLGFLPLHLRCSLLPFLPTTMASSSSGTMSPSKVFFKFLRVMCFITATEQGLIQALCRSSNLFSPSLSAPFVGWRFTWVSSSGGHEW